MRQRNILKEEIIMNSFENNAFFWQKLDTLFLSSKLVIDRPRNTCHYKYSNLVYPVDYGYLNDTTGSDLDNDRFAPH